EKRVMPRTGIDPSLQQSVATLLGWALIVAAIALALAHLGIEAQQIALIAGALSVGIGFGLQSVVSNFVSGIILLAERPIRVGEHPQVLPTPPPRVYLIAFGDIGLELELRFIVVNVNYSLTVKSEIQLVILQRLRAAGVRIPALPHEAALPGGAGPGERPRA